MTNPGDMEELARSPAELVAKAQRLLSYAANNGQPEAVKESNANQAWHVLASALEALTLPQADDERIDTGDEPWGDDALDELQTRLPKHGVLFRGQQMKGLPRGLEEDLTRAWAAIKWLRDVRRAATPIATVTQECDCSDCRWARDRGVTADSIGNQTKR